MFTCMTSSPEETGHLAELVGQKIREGTVLCLEGDLGAGKTLFVQSLAHTLGVEGDVTSPTFNLMNVYEGICRIYHLTSTGWKQKKNWMISAFMSTRRSRRESWSLSGPTSSRSHCPRIILKCAFANWAKTAMNGRLIFPV